MTWMMTYTGKRFDPFHPTVESIDIVDIAHALSNTCRFGGQIEEFYSVAQHSVYVSELSQGFELWGLLHDAAEAYLVDLPRPTKEGLRQMGITIFDDLERNIMRVICQKFGLPTDQPPIVHTADKIVYTTEVRDLTGRNPNDAVYKPTDYRILPYMPRVAKDFFLDRFRELTNG